jgi:hypothetical protein
MLNTMAFCPYMAPLRQPAFGKPADKETGDVPSPVNQGTDKKPQGRSAGDLPHPSLLGDAWRTGSPMQE